MGKEKWKETKTIKFAERLPAILEYMFVTHEQREIGRIEEGFCQAKREHDRITEERKQQEAEERSFEAYKEATLDRMVKEQAEKWMEAEKYRAYAEAIEKNLPRLQSPEDIEKSSERASRLRRIANRLDSLPDRAMPPDSISKPHSGVLREYYKQ